MSKESAFQGSWWKWLVLLLIAAASYHFTFPAKDKVRLGLDIKGGTSFTLGVDVEKLRENILAENPALTNSPEKVDAQVAKTLGADCDDRIVAVIRKRVDAMGTNEPVIQSLPKKHQIIVQLPGADESVRKAAKERLQSMAFLEFRLTHPKDQQLVAKLLSKDIAPEGYEKKGNGYARTAAYTTLVRQPGYAARLASFGTTDDRYRFMLEDNKDGTYQPHFVSRNVELDGRDLESASWERDPVKGGFCVNFVLNAEGGRKFSTLTRNYMAGGPKNRTSEGRCLAIILDDVLISAPRIQSEIGSSGQITGNFTIQEAKQLAADLNAGALPAPLRILAESSVAPTVGEDAIHSGIWAAALGFGLVAIFMFIYYWRLGLVADLALFLDVALLPTALVVVANLLGVFAHDPSMGGGGSVQLPVLTMPGIAGLVLTLGMAVDANVLIFERIREEFSHAGMTAGKAIQNGYGRAFTAIFDSNLTTIITGVILFVFGTGPVRGFAIMLTSGVVISMYTAVVVSRLILEKTTNLGGTKPFKMLRLLSGTHIDFMKYGKVSLIASAAVIVVSLAVFAIRAKTNPASVLAVDLTGGTSIVYNLTQDEAKQPSVGAIREVLNGFDNATIIQYQRGIGDTTLLVKTGESAETKKGRELKDRDVGGYVTKLLQAKFPEAAFENASTEEIGSMVGDDLKKSGTKAVIFSLIAILIYIGFRFQIGFGFGGIVALAHDALISLGLFSLCGRQVSLIVVTALLTIIGYSINDTVVIFDRIREKLRHDDRTPVRDICNQAINECLGRTIITSVTTLLAVFALFAFGDGSIFDFALTMLIGIIAGTYSTTFIATPLMVWWYRGKRPSFGADDKPKA